MRGTSTPIISAEAIQLMMYADGGMTQMVQMDIMHEWAWTRRLGRAICTRAWFVLVTQSVSDATQVNRFFPSLQYVFNHIPRHTLPLDLQR